MQGATDHYISTFVRSEYVVTEPIRILFKWLAWCWLTLSCSSLLLRFGLLFPSFGNVRMVKVIDFVTGCSWLAYPLLVITNFPYFLESFTHGGKSFYMACFNFAVASFLIYPAFFRDARKK
jgi:hypothetical protein